MAYLLPFRPAASLALSAALLLSGCCANNVCNPDDPLADAVKLRFSTAFATSDLDTIIIQRYPKAFTPNTQPEIVTLIRTAGHERDSVLLNNTAPFARVGTTNLGAYRFVVQYIRPKKVVATALVIDSIRIRGGFTGNGCCTNYTNSGKTVFAKDSTFDLKQLPFLRITK